MPSAEGSLHEREAAFAARWGAGEWRGETLHAMSGERYLVIYQGRPGGGTGPDFLDAVLVEPGGRRIFGDVELHLKPENWRAHGHERDARYNGLAVHIAIHASRTHAEDVTTLASGRTVPLVLLHPLTHMRGTTADWPCVALVQRMDAKELRALLVAAGVARFDLRAVRLTAELQSGHDPLHAIERGQDAARADRPVPLIEKRKEETWSCADRVLFIAVAEALAYGRDRVALREAGRRLVAGVVSPALASLEHRLPRIEGQRLRGLLALHARWHASGPWQPLCTALESESARRAACALIRHIVVEGGLVSSSRAAIVVANVVLPFAAAVGLRQGDLALAERAALVYRALPGLPSNAITREMARQLGLTRLPRGALAQLGLHHLWAEHCREKRCDGCPCNLSTRSIVHT
jgi:hypothetical protein